MDLLPHERFDEYNDVMDVMDSMATTLGDDSLCAQYEMENKKRFWPKYHCDLKMLTETNTYLGVEVTKGNENRTYRTRFMINKEQVDSVRNPRQLARGNVQSLINSLKDDLQAEVFDEKTLKIIKDTRLITHLKTLSSDLKKEDPVVLGHKRAVSYLKAVRRLTTLDIAGEEIKDDFRKFLKILHKHVAGIQDKLSSRNIIKDILNSSLK